MCICQLVSPVGLSVAVMICEPIVFKLNACILYKLQKWFASLPCATAASDPSQFNKQHFKTRGEKLTSETKTPGKTNLQGDWAGVAFDSMSWRSTGTSILRGLDDIQQLLDDQVIKTQSMRASPYIGPFEERVRVWEAKLNMMQVGCGTPESVYDDLGHAVRFHKALVAAMI